MDGGLNMAEELRSALRWESSRMGAVSRSVLLSVISRLDAIYEEIDKTKENCSMCKGTGKISDGHEDFDCQHCKTLSW
jgi:tRNA(Ile2) C34 agmatinyltransferase TiaS